MKINYKLCFLSILISFFVFNIVKTEGSTYDKDNFLRYFNQKITFTENKGQVIDSKNNSMSDILFTTEKNGIKCFLSKKSISYVFSKVENDSTNLNSVANSFSSIQKLPTNTTIASFRLDMELLNANPDTRVIALDEEAFYKNYYLSHCKTGILNIKSYKKLLYTNIYPNIDMVIYSIDNNMKYDFIIHPGGNIKDIKMHFTGAQEIKITKEGKLQVYTPFGFIQENAPLTYQEFGNKREVINSAFIKDNNTVCFSIGNYDRKKTITIDPTRQWATFIGGNSDDWVFGSTADKTGNIYLSGFTNSTNLPSTSGAYQSTYGGSQDAFLAKINSNGSPIWITYYGGNSADDGRSVSIDNNGGIFLNGFTRSTNFPVSTGAFQTSHAGGTLDAFLVKFNNNGSRQWATYYGGSGDDYGVELTTDSKANIIMCGFTSSTNFPVNSGAFQTSYAGGSNDAFAVKLNSSGIRQWATYYGGSGDDRFYAVTSDTSDNYYLNGFTSSTNFPVSSSAYQSTKAGANDLGLVKFNNSGSRQWATYYGGSGDDLLFAAKFSNDNNLYLTGLTKSSNFPVSSGAFQTSNAGGTNDGFLLKFSSSGSRIWATYFGGSGQDDGYRMAIDNSGMINIAGYTLSTNFPVTSNAFQSSYGGGARDAYLIIFNSGGSRYYSTYYGGNDDDYSAGISVDSLNNIYLAGSAYSTNLPITTGAYQTTKAGGNDLFLVKFSPDKPVVTVSGPLTFCDGDSVLLSTAIPYSAYQWSHGPTSRSVTIKKSGKYVVTVKDANNVTTTSDTVEVKINLKPKANFTFINNCQGKLIYLYDSSIIASGTLTYAWDLGDGRKSTLKDIATIYSNPGIYNVKLVVTSNNGCIDSITKTISVFANPKADFTVSNMVCKGASVSLNNTSIIPANTNVSYFWNFGDGNSSTQVSPVHTYLTEGTFNIKLIVTTNNGCIDSITKSITVQPVPVANFSFINSCTGIPVSFSDSSFISQGTLNYEWDFGDGGNSIIKNPIYTFNKPGNFDIKLKVKSNFGCIDSIIKTIIIYPRPTRPDITANGSLTFCEGDSVELSAGPGYSSYLWSTGDTTQSIVIKQSGAYKVIVSNINGCLDSSSTALVTVNSANFNVSFTENQRILTTQPYSVVFTNTTPNPTNYDFTWKFGDGNTSNQESPIYSYQDSGLFTITLIAKNKVTGCMDSLVKKDWILVSKLSNILSIPNTKPEVIIYPNPTTNSFSVDIKNPIQSGLQLILFDGLGRKLEEKHLKPNETQRNLMFDLNNSTKGIYFLKVISNNANFTYKVIKN